MKVRLNRLYIVGLSLLFAALALVIVSRSGDDESLQAKEDPAPLNENIASPSAQDKPAPNSSLGGREAPQNRKPSSSPKGQIGSTESFLEIENLLTNDNISNEQATRQLAEIVLNPNRPEPERLEAMEHAKNLGFAHLLPLSLDPNLPLPLAESYLHGLHGHDQTKEQVSGALGLLNHADPDIREQAQTLLGFLLGKEEDNESPDKLRAAADAFLKQPDEGDGNEH
jgi:hypothetical protein